MLTRRVTGYNLGEANTSATAEHVSTKSLRSAFFF
jgi:hypothetical protein